MTDRQDLTDVRLAILATDGVEQIELTEPVALLRAAGATVDVIAPAATFRGFDGLEPADEFDADRTVADADPDDYAAIVLPGGVANPDNLRTDEDAVRFVRAFVDADKLLAAICHAPWLLIEANAVSGRRLTSFASVRTDLENAGARWVDEQVVIDRDEPGILLTSRGPADLDAFGEAIIGELVEVDG